MGPGAIPWPMLSSRDPTYPLIDMLVALGFFVWAMTVPLGGRVRISTTINVAAQVSSMQSVLVWHEV